MLINIKKIKEVIKDTKGVGLIELSFVLPVFLYIIFATIEFAFMFHVYMVLQDAGKEASRLAMTGSTYSGDIDLNPEEMDRTDFIDKVVRDQLGNWLTREDQISFTTEIYDDAVTASTGTASGAGVGADNGGNIVVYHFQLEWDFRTPFMEELLTAGSADPFVLATSIGVENEDFCSGTSCFSD